MNVTFTWDHQLALEWLYSPSTLNNPTQEIVVYIPSLILLIFTSIILFFILWYFSTAEET